MKVIINTTIVAVTLIAATTAVQADTVWVTPFKGAPYATQAESAPNAVSSQDAAKRTLRFLKNSKDGRAYSQIQAGK